MASRITDYLLIGGYIAASLAKKNKRTYPVLWILINQITKEQINVEGSIHFARDLRVVGLPSNLVRK